MGVGGTFTDFTVFPGAHPGSDNPSMVAQLNFSMPAWAAVNELVSMLPGSTVVVSLSGLLRHWHEAGLPWDGANAAAFVEENKRRGYKIYGYELGNEPGCWNMHGGVVSPAQHARDFGVLRKILHNAYPEAADRPRVIGPDTTGCGGDIFKQILDEAPDWDVSTIHVYSTLPDANVSTFLRAAQTNAMCTKMSQQLAWLRNSTLSHTPLWNGEGGESYLSNGGGGYLHHFGGALSILNNIGCLSSSGVSLFLKHDLFENMLVPPQFSEPYPSFWAAFLFKQLISLGLSSQVGDVGVLPANVSGNQLVHAYGFAASGSGARKAILAVNLGNETASLRSSLCRGPQFLKAYEITAYGDPATQGLDPILNAVGLSLNGEHLELTRDGNLPSLEHRLLACDAVLEMQPFSAAFLVEDAAVRQASYFTI